MNEFPAERSRATAAAVVAGAALAVAGMLAAAAASAGLVVMHGYADRTSASLWIQPDAPGRVTVAWRPAGDAVDRRITLDAAAADDNVVNARLIGLPPGGTATYRIEAGGEVREGTVRAQPHWTSAADAPVLTFAIGSCFFLPGPDPAPRDAKYGDGYGIFAAIATKTPDVMLWLGDNLYLQPGDFYDPAAMAARYRRQRGFEPLQGLLTATTHLAIWDDHDYGPNDATAAYRLKRETLRLFNRYWPNPASGLPDVPGTFGVARYGDVLFFLLDDRYYRSPQRAPDGPGKTMFGARQIEWLKQALRRAPRESLKFVAGGSQFWHRGHRFEGWHHFEAERSAFAAWLLAERIDGVIFLSGDRHFSELLRVPRTGSYPLWEFTSSPLTSRPPAKLARLEHDNPDVVPGTLAIQRQFGLVRVSGAEDRRRVALESYDSAGTLLWRHELEARDLRFPRE